MVNLTMSTDHTRDNALDNALEDALDVLDGELDNVSDNALAVLLDNESEVVQLNSLCTY